MDAAPSPDRRRRRYLQTLAATCSLAITAGCTSSSTDSDQPGGANNDTGGGTNVSNDSTGSESTSVHSSYETTAVEIRDESGTALGSVTAAIADTGDLRFTGLSDTESLPEDRGMLFVYDSVGSREYVMREMDFPIDIVYVDGEKRITKIHHAPAPGPNEDGESEEFTFPGRGQYVLEVNYNWTTERGIETGDVLSFEL